MDTRSLSPDRRLFLSWCDCIVTGGILFLVVFTPLAFGAVHPWAFSLMEGIVFMLGVVWMTKLLLSSPSPQPSPLLPLILPILFISLILFQLLPLPPSLLRLLSPSTYELYAKSLPGWPERIPYGEHPTQTPDPHETSSWALLPPMEEAQKGAPVLHAKGTTETRRHGDTETVAASPPRPDAASQLSPSLSLSPWRPLSIAPSLSRTDLLKLLAYALLFFLVLLYPFGPSQKASGHQSAVSGQAQTMSSPPSSPPLRGGTKEGRVHAEEKFFRSVLLMVLFTGLLVALIGLIQRFSWNGKILWFFVPYDWGVPRPEGTPHATGPFVSHVHFANYLALIFPLALVGTLSRRFLAPPGKAFRPVLSQSQRLFCGFAVFVMLMGILLSLSRAAWIGIALGVGILLWVFLSQPEEKRPSLLRRPRGLVVRYSLAGLFLLLVLAFLFVGPSGRRQMDARLEETVMREANLWVRVSAWEDSLGMIRDFPLFGVGLGGWPELFPRYQRPPWSRASFRQAHNDYLELLAETGFVGLGLLAWFFWQGGRRLFRALKTLPPKSLPVFAALLSALGIMAFHEFFDFNLQIPANAFLFTLFLGIALRQATSAETLSYYLTALPLRPVAPWAVGTGVVAFILLILAFRQEGLPYPYNIQEPTSFTEAREVLLSHPARSSTHLSLFRLLKDRAPLSQRLKELEIALWLDPRNPSARDRYAAGLVQQGREKEALKEISRSVFFSPSRSSHFYLSRRLIPRLSSREQKAVEEGFKRASAFGSERVVGELGTFYAALGRFSEAGKLYAEAALKKDAVQVRYLLKAGLAYARAGDAEKAETILRQATAAVPQDPRPYHYLATRVFAPRGDLSLAKAVISEGIKNGADPFSLHLSLAKAARRAHDGEEAKAALFQALTLHPTSFEARFRLGLLYLQERNFERAALSLREAADLNPHSARAFYHLGRAEEKRYRFLAAEKAYARAIELAPGHTGFQRRYEVFQRKVEDSGKGNR